MGNLCSSGTDRSEKKKEEANLPDKPQDGEDEALLSKAGEGVGVANNEDGGSGGGNGGGFGDLVGGALSSGQNVAADVVNDAKKEVEEAGENVKKEGVEVAEVVDGIAKDKVNQVADDAGNSVTAGLDKLVDLKEDVNSSENKLSSQADALKQDIVSSVEEAKSAAESEVQSSEVSTQQSGGFVEGLKQNVSETFEEAKEVVEEKVEDTKQTAENRLNEAVESAKASVSNMFSSTTQSVEEKANEAEGSFANAVNENVTDVKSSVEQSTAAVGDIKDSFGSMLNEVKSDASGELEKTSDAADDKIGNITTGVGDRFESTVAFGDDIVAEKMNNVESGIETAQQRIVDQKELLESNKNEESGLLDNLKNVASSGVQSGVAVVKEKAVEKVQDAFGDKKEYLGEQDNENGDGDGLFDSLKTSASSGIQSGVAVVGDKVVEKVQDVLGDGSKPEEEDISKEVTEFHEEVATNSSDDNYLDKAKSLLEQHRNSIDESKMAANMSVEEAESPLSEMSNGVREGVAQVSEIGGVSFDANEVKDADDVTLTSLPEEVADKVREETARDFVDNIIEKATNIVSESLADEESKAVNGDESVPAQANDISPEQIVERGEETLEVKKRGVCFVSPQISDDTSSSSPLSSPPEILPSPEITCSPPDTLGAEAAVEAAAEEVECPVSPASSISQGELVERDIEMELPSPPPSISLQQEQRDDEDTEDMPSPEMEGQSSSVAEESEEEDHEPEGGPLDNRPLGDLDDESLQRVAMEVTSKAVQDAIKIVTENGTGVGLNNNINSNNDNDNNNPNAVMVNSLNSVEVSSPSTSDERDRDGEDEEDMTTTNSSQVERGSSVSDLTDTSQHGSIAESLSSYDPGAVYRQDLAELSDTKSASPVDQSAAAAAAATTNECVPKAGDGTFEASSSVSAALSVDMSLLQSANEASSSSAETPTPTNVTSFEDLPPPPPPTATANDSEEHNINNNNNNDNNNDINTESNTSESVTETEQSQKQEEKESNTSQSTTPHNAADDIGKDSMTRNPETAADADSDLPPPPPAPFSVPSSLPDMDSSYPAPSKVSIVINSPDSAPKTNGSPETEEVSAQPEALI